MYREGANTVGKQHFTSLYSRAREQTFISRNIKSDWSKTGLYSFSSDRVFKDNSKSLVELYVSKNDEVKMKSCSQGVVLQTSVTSKALISLRSRIEHDAHLLDGPSKRHLQKLGNAAQKAFAERALLDENRLLFEQNDESSCRQSTRSTVVDKAKMMSHDDIVEAQAKRDVKEVVIKEKRDPKRKSSASLQAKAKRTLKSEVKVAEDKIKALGLRNYCSVPQL